jgi:hypothetical protein
VELLKQVTNNNDSSDKHGANLLEDNRFAYSQVYIESMLKLGLTFEINHNYSQAKNIYLQAELESKKIFEQKKQSIEGKVSVLDAKFDYLTQGYWARLYLNIKRSPSAYSCQHNNVLPSHVNDMYNGCNDVKHYKLAIYYFFINQFEDAKEHLDNIIFEHSDQLDDSTITERKSYLLGRVYLYSGLVDIILMFRQYEQQDMSVAGSRFLDIIDSCSVLSKTQTDNETISSLRDKIIHPDNEIPDNQVLLNAIYKFLLSTLIFQSSGLHTNSIYSHVAIVLSWGLFLEALPSRFYEDEFGAVIKQRIQNAEKVFEYIENICEKSYADSIKTHQKSFADMINEHYEFEIKPLGVTLSEEVNPINNLKAYLNDPNTNTNKTNSINNNNDDVMKRIYWQRSLQGQYLTEMYLWQRRAYENVFRDNSSIKDININDFPQYGIRSFSLALVLTAKNKLIKLKQEKRKDCINISECLDLAVESIFYYHHASQYLSRSSGNEQEVTFPPISHVYFNMWEVLLEIYTILKQHSDKKSNRDIHNELYQHSQKHPVGIKSLDVPYSMYNLDSVKKMAELYLSRTAIATDSYSKIHQDVLSEKHYLHDDYDDPMFIFDVFYFKAFSVPAKWHLEQIKEDMERFEKKQ